MYEALGVRHKVVVKFTSKFYTLSSNGNLFALFESVTCVYFADSCVFV